MIGNSDNVFIEVRRQGLEIFCQELAILKHLWYSNEFQTFLRKNGDVEKVAFLALRILKPCPQKESTTKPRQLAINGGARQAFEEATDEIDN